MKKIAIVFNGGTISMKLDKSIGAAVPALSSQEILSMVDGIERYADIEVINYSSKPGPHITPKDMLEIRDTVHRLIQDESVYGVVITHGTDSLEETAYFLDLTLDCSKPVIVVGAMRNSSELGYDGPANIAAAICTAISPESIGRGVLVVMNNEVNSAQEVTKTHTQKLDTFKSMEFGPLGIVDGDEVLYFRKGVINKYYPITSIDCKVGLIKCGAGMDSDILNFMIDNNYEGIVLEAMGRGNIPPSMVSGVKRAIDSGIPVVIASRCPTGRVLDSYGYDGAGRSLTNLGAIMAGSLPGHKARIKLMILLSWSKDLKLIKTHFEEGLYH